MKVISTVFGEGDYYVLGLKMQESGGPSYDAIPSCFKANKLKGPKFMARAVQVILQAQGILKGTQKGIICISSSKSLGLNSLLHTTNIVAPKVLHLR